MKKHLLIPIVLALSLVSIISFADDTIFGPKQYYRTVGPPNLYSDVFNGVNREAKIKVINGDENGNNRIKSAVITVNNKTVFGPNEFNQRVGFIEKNIELQEDNAISVKLRSGKPASFVTVEIDSSFYEEFPAWRMPELTVTNLEVIPERCDQGDSVILRTTVANTGKGNTRPCTVVLSIDGVEISREPINTLVPQATMEVNTTWQAEGPGRHLVFATLEVKDADFDGNSFDNAKSAAVRVSGEVDPEPGLEFSDIDFPSLQLMGDNSYTIPIKTRNPSFARIESTLVNFYIDNEYKETWEIEALDPGDEMVFELPWNNIPKGEHTILAKVTLREDIEIVRNWHVIVPDETVIYDAIDKGKWVSIGPKKLDNDWVGRITSIVFDPKNPMIVYASGGGSDMGLVAAAGVWKSTNGGSSWYPVGDKLSSMAILFLALDPKNPNIVYANGVDGIFKSIDGGINWSNFAGPNIMSYAKLKILYTGKNEVMIYAATANGLWRYKSSDPFAQKSDPSEWDLIKTGDIRDIAVHPNDSSTLFVSIGHQIKRTKVGETIDPATADLYWDNLTFGLPTIGTSVTLDIQKFNPDKVYAGIRQPRVGFDFGIYRSDNGGDTWKALKEYANGELDGSLYNPYIRVVPLQTENLDIVYFGGVNLYQLIATRQFKPATFEVSGYNVPMQAGVDLKALEFVPGLEDKFYWSAGDQGIFQCTVETLSRKWQLKDKQYGESGDICISRNQDLRVTEFYDIDVSKNNPNLIIGGTQDSGTVLYTGDPTWKMIKGGDGLYSLINPFNDNIMYGQYQSFNSTLLSYDGGDTWPLSILAHLGAGYLPTGYGLHAYITNDLNPMVQGIIAIGNGDALYHILRPDWCLPYFFVNEIQNPRPDKNETFTQVVVLPNYDWVIGTSKGRILYRKYPQGDTYVVFNHPYKAYVLSISVSTVDSDIIFVTFQTNVAPETRIWRFGLDTSNPLNSTKFNLTDNFPSNRFPRVVCADANHLDVVFIGTDKGVFWKGSECYSNLCTWQPYNDGFPLTTVVDLVTAPDKTLVAATKGRGAWKVITGP